MARQWANEVRSLNRMPFAMGVLALVTALAIAVVQVLGGWSWGFALIAVVVLALGVGLIALYYRFRESDERGNPITEAEKRAKDSS